MTGPVQGRPQAPREVIETLGIPKGYDFTGLAKRILYFRSHDGGAHWKEVGASNFDGAVGNSFLGGGAHLVLPDGTLIRRVNGWDLMPDPNVPHTAYLQRSTDGGKTWGKPRVLLDPDKFMYQFSRLRTLRDGRLVATGQVWPTPAGTPAKRLAHVLPELLLMTSSDNGKTWVRHHVTTAEHRGVVWDEWDQAELPSGDLLAMFRRGDPKNRNREVRWQGLLRKKGDSWVLEKFRPAVFPHSGHPDLLATREGIVLHFATSGVHWTADGGETWHPLEGTGPRGGYKTRYYPRGIQTDDGRIYVFAHNGWDNKYGEVDQSIVLDTFRLAPK
jgi:hypothetical protein